MWVYVFLGNMLRGIGETPITPLGVSYLDDFSREENTAFYIGTKDSGLTCSEFTHTLHSLSSYTYCMLCVPCTHTLAISVAYREWVNLVIISAWHLVL